MQTITQDVKEGDILVCHWGYSMSLVTFVKVMRVTTKTVTAIELEQERANEATLLAHGLHKYDDGFQGYMIPKVRFVQNWDGKVEHVKLYQRGDSFISKKAGFTKFFKKWDGVPQYENTCD